jgi:hypothetical protein
MNRGSGREVPKLGLRMVSRLCREVPKLAGMAPKLGRVSTLGEFLASTCAGVGTLKILDGLYQGAGGTLRQFSLHHKGDTTPDEGSWWC